jgi:hypothetical protein
MPILKSLSLGIDLCFCTAAFIKLRRLGLGWGAEFRNRYFELHFRSALKLAKANCGNGWDVVAEMRKISSFRKAEKQRLLLLRHLAAGLS